MVGFETHSLCHIFVLSVSSIRFFSQSRKAWIERTEQLFLKEPRQSSVKEFKHNQSRVFLYSNIVNL